jgi:hypothetical protein
MGPAGAVLAPSRLELLFHCSCEDCTRVAILDTALACNTALAGGALNMSGNARAAANITNSTFTSNAALGAPSVETCEYLGRK